ncbi:MAG: signal transduction histidine kinase [Saprospiraceae bacterium]|jgi:signal transduction histidine kinase/streptogramin lyase
MNCLLLKICFNRNFCFRDRNERRPNRFPFSATISFIFLFICCLPAAFSQKYITSFTNYSTEDGLSDNLVGSFLEDSGGFVWLSTRRGLNRFDGQNFKVFYQKNEENNSHCGDAYEDVNGHVWVSFMKEKGQIKKGYNYYLIDKSYTIHAFKDYFKEHIPFEEDLIYGIQQMKNRVLYLTLTTGQIFKYDGKFTLLIADDSYGEARVSPKMEVSGNVYLLTKQYIITINPDGKIINQYDRLSRNHLASPVNNSEEYKWTPPIFEQGFFSISTFRNEAKILEEFNYETAIKDRNPLSKETIIYTLPYQNQAYYCTVQSGNIALFDKEKKLIYDFYPVIAESIGDNYVTEEVLFRPNQIWYGNNQGFCILDYKLNPFDQYLNTGMSFSTRGITKLSDGRLIVIAYRQITEIDEQTGSIKRLSFKNRSKKRGLIELDNIHLLFGTYGSEFEIYNSETGESTFTDVREEDELGYGRNPLFIPFKDSKDNLWFGTLKGVLRYNPIEKSVEASVDYHEYGELKKEEVTYLEEAGEGIWLATTNGLYILDADRGIINHFAPFPKMVIKHFYREGFVFWLATTSHGLVKWNMESGETRQINKETGLLDDQLMAVYPDTSGNLWLSSERGIIRFEKATGNIQTYLESDGITNNEFNISSHYQAADGKIYFGGLNGVTAFYPEDVKIVKEEEPPFILTNYYQTDGDTIQDKLSDFIQHPIIKITPNTISTTIHFSYLNYKNVSNTRFAFKVEGLDNNWTYQNENFIRLNRLPYGKYQLKIKAQDYSSQWIGQELSIPIEVIAPFYEQTHWQLLGIGTALLLMYLSFKWRLQRNKVKQKKLELLVEKRTAVVEKQKEELKDLNFSLQTSNETKDRLFAILGHDLRNPVLSFQNLSKSLSYLLESKQYGRIIEVGDFLEKQAQELYHLLDNLLHWALSQRNDLPIGFSKINLSEIVNIVFKNNANLSETAEISLKSSVSEDIFIESDARILETVFRNLISNAFRFTKPGGWVKVSAERIGQQVKISVSDNGEGMRKEKLETLFTICTLETNQQQDGRLSLGLHLCQELIELVDGQIAVESEEGKGTTFTIVLPVANG